MGLGGQHFAVVETLDGYTIVRDFETPLAHTATQAPPLFWATSEYAAALGRGRAERLALGLSSRPGVIAYGKEQLGLRDSGVLEETLAGAHSAFGFRHAGLRLLIRSDDKCFLLPNGWTRSTGTAIALPDVSGLRFEFTVGR